MTATTQGGRQLALWLRRLADDAETGLLRALSIEFTEGQEARIAVKVDAMSAHQYEWMPGVEDETTDVDIPIPGRAKCED